MKFFVIIVFVALFAVAVARPDHAHIVKSNSEVEHDHYNYDVETSDGKSHHEEGVLKDIGREYPAMIVHGSYSYKDEHDGQVYTVNYVADENGFHPVGEHLPQLPKIVL